MRRSSRTFATALVLAATLPGCAPAPVDDPRCAEWAPEVSPPVVVRTAPPGWPDPPPGDVLCGTTFTGDESASVEVVIAVTDRSPDEVLDYYEAELPEELAVERRPGDVSRLWGYADGVLYAIEPAGERRYTLVFQKLAGATGG
jgi:hypothetical protein